MDTSARQSPHGAGPSLPQPVLSPELNLIPFPTGRYSVSIARQEHAPREIGGVWFPNVLAAVFPSSAGTTIDGKDSAWLVETGNPVTVEVAGAGGIVAFITLRPVEYGASGLQINVVKLGAAPVRGQPAHAASFQGAAPGFPRAGGNQAAQPSGFAFGAPADPPAGFASGVPAGAPAGFAPGAPAAPQAGFAFGAPAAPQAGFAFGAPSGPPAGSRPQHGPVGAAAQATGRAQDGAFGQQGAPADPAWHAGPAAQNPARHAPPAPGVAPARIAQARPFQSPYAQPGFNPAREAPRHAQPVPPDAPGRRREAGPAPQVLTCGHIQGRGDVLAAPGEGVGQPSSRLRLEAVAFKVEGIPPGDLEYATVSHDGVMSPWTSFPYFSGSKGLGLPLAGFVARLKGETASRYDVAYSGTFLKTGQTPDCLNGQFLHSNVRGDALESLRLRLVPRC